MDGFLKILRISDFMLILHEKKVKNEEIQHFLARKVPPNAKFSKSTRGLNAAESADY